MNRLIDLTGQRFGKLIVIKRVENDKSNSTQWLCKCDCGKLKKVSGRHLKDNSTKSCGCLKSEIIKKHSPQNRSYNLKHNLSNTRIYTILESMKQRCYNKKCKSYKNYGGRGIKICNEWLEKNGEGFMNFYNWAMKNGYQEGLSIDRIDVNGNYEPNNCRWVTMKVQQNNRTNNHIVEFNNQKHTLADWSKILKIDKNILYNRISNRNWNIEKAFSQKVRNFKRKVIQYDLNYNFIQHFNSINEASENTKVLPQTISRCCRSKVKTAGGYIWRYADEDTNR